MVNLAPSEIYFTLITENWNGQMQAYNGTISGCNFGYQNSSSIMSYVMQMHIYNLLSWVTLSHFECTNTSGGRSMGAKGMSFQFILTWGRPCSISRPAVYTLRGACPGPHPGRMSMTSMIALRLSQSTILSLCLLVWFQPLSASVGLLCTSLFLVHIFVSVTITVFNESPSVVLIVPVRLSEIMRDQIEDLYMTIFNLRNDLTAIASASTENYNYLP